MISVTHCPIHNKHFLEAPIKGCHFLSSRPRSGERDSPIYASLTLRTIYNL